MIVVEKRNFVSQNRAGTRGRRISVINISRTQKRHALLPVWCRQRGPVVEEEEAEGY